MTLDELRAAIQSLEMQALPTLRSVTLHPDDFALLIKAVRTDHNMVAAESFPHWRMGDVYLFTNENVPRGRPWYDPPEAAGQLRCVAHEDCRMHAALARDCWLSTYAMPRHGTAEESKV